MVHPVRGNGDVPVPATSARGRGGRRLFVPLTGAWILGLDWLIFSQNLLTLGGAGWPLAVALGFLFGGLGTLLLQRFVGQDRWPAALGKALIGALVVGVPFPVLGTVVGGWVLIASGLGRGKRS